MNPSNPINPYLETAIEAVTAASAVCRRIRAEMTDPDTLTKADRSPVTVADFASQAMVCDLLRRRFADVAVVAEEDGEALTLPQNRPLLEKAARFLGHWSVQDTVRAIQWGTRQPGDLFFTLDPIDGTKGFLRGGQYTVALAMIRDGKVVLGVLGCPALALDGTTGALFWAQEGQGAFVRPLDKGPDRPIRVCPGRGGARFLESVESGHSDHRRQADIHAAFGQDVHVVRMDSQAKYGALALGDADVYLRLPAPETPDYREKIWDHAAGALVVAGAGGKVTDINGKDLDFARGRCLTANRGIVATNGGLHEAVLGEIAKTQSETSNG